MRGRRSKLVLVVVAIAALGTGSCDGGTPARRAAPVAPPEAEVSAPPCPPDNSYAEVMAAGGEVTGTPGVFWGLLFIGGGRLPAAEQVKIALRMTGAGELTLRAVGPGGTTVTPLSVDRHDGSTWRRPGDEWGSYWLFPAPGCWTIRADRADGTKGALTLHAG